MKINYYFSFLLLMICIVAPALGGVRSNAPMDGGDAKTACQDCSVMMDYSSAGADDVVAGSSKTPKLLRRKILRDDVQDANKDPQVEEEEQAEVYDIPTEDDDGDDDDGFEISDEDLEQFHSALTQEDHPGISQEERKLIFANLFGSGGASELSEQDRKRLFNGKFFRKINKQGKLWNFLHDQFKKHEGKNESSENGKHWEFSMVRTPSRALGPFGRAQQQNTNRGLHDGRIDTATAAVGVHHGGTTRGLKSNNDVAQEEE